MIMLKTVFTVLISTVSAWGAANLDGAPIIQIKLKWSNVFLVKGTKPFLIDSGSRGDFPELEKKLAREKVNVSDLVLIILTSGLADHAGLAKEIRLRSQAKILVGQGDLDVVKNGQNGEIKDTSFLIRFFSRYIPASFEAFEPDIIISSDFDLTPYGVGGQVIPMPGHTPGSLVVALNDKRYFVGDMIDGGYLNGAFFAHSPKEHIYHVDEPRNIDNIRKVLAMRAETFYLGHGGPVSREDVSKMH